MMNALNGIKVLDLTSAYSGPFGGMLLADHGAEVIKIEPPNGDQTRAWGPFEKKSGESAYFAQINRNKKGITLNLKNSQALQLFYELVSEADVVIENYRPGVAKKLKIDYETLRHINPQLIYGACSGFGQNGPLAQRACYDTVAQCVSGLASMTGYPDSPPTTTGPCIVDAVSGIYLAFGVSLALNARNVTGKGQMVDVAMVDSALSILENSIVEYTVAGVIPGREGNRDTSICPFDVYEAKDGYIAVGVGNDRLFDRFCKAIHHEELLDNPEFKTNDLRCQNYKGLLHDTVQQWVHSYQKAEVENILSDAGIPCGIVLNMKEVIENPQTKAREMIVEIEHPTMGRIKIQGVNVKLSDTPGRIEKASPLLGQDTQDIFHLSDDEYKRMKSNGIF